MRQFLLVCPLHARVPRLIRVVVEFPSPAPCCPSSTDDVTTDCVNTPNYFHKRDVTSLCLYTYKGVCVWFEQLYKHCTYSIDDAVAGTVTPCPSYWTHFINTYCHPWFLLLITSVNLSKWCPQSHPSSRWVQLCWAWSRTSRWLFLACCSVGIRCPRGSGCTTTAWWGHREEFDFEIVFHILHTLILALGWIKRISFNFCQVTSDQYVSVRRDGSLHIERVRLDDAGDYTCLAENAVGAANHTTAVNVYGSKQTHKISTRTSAWSRYPPTFVTYPH